MNGLRSRHAQRCDRAVLHARRVAFEALQRRDDDELVRALATLRRLARSRRTPISMRPRFRQAHNVVAVTAWMHGYHVDLAA